MNTNLTAWMKLAIAAALFWACTSSVNRLLGRMNRRAHRRLLTATIYAALTLCATLFAAPFAWIVCTSLKVDSQIFTSDLRWAPTVPTYPVATKDSFGSAIVEYAPIAVVDLYGRHVHVVQIAKEANGMSRVGLIDSAHPGPMTVADEVLIPSSSIRPISQLAPQWHNYPDALASFPFLQYTLNTLIICCLTTIGAVVSSTIPAYGFARLKWRGRDALFFILIASIMLPPQVTMLPVFIIFRALHWTGTILPLVVPAFCGPAFYIFLLRQFFLTIPQELVDAARIDGCSHPGILWRIIAPISRPALVTVGLLAFTSAWMDFTGPLIYLQDERTYTLALGLLAFLGRHGAQWSLLMAAATVITVPMVLLFLCAQRTYIQGITLTGIKG